MAHPISQYMGVTPLRVCDVKELLDAPRGALPKNIFQLTYLAHHTWIFFYKFRKIWSI